MRIKRTHLGMTVITGLAPIGTSGGQGAAIDVGKRNRDSAGVGDYFIATSTPLLDAHTKRRVGRADAVELVLSRSADFVTMTARLADGTLQVNGQRRHPGRVSVLPVIGGTGACANARGTMTLAEIGETGRARITFGLVPSAGRRRRDRRSTAMNHGHPAATARRLRGSARRRLADLARHSRRDRVHASIAGGALLPVEERGRQNHPRG
jgi:hypothetical protein